MGRRQAASGAWSRRAETALQPWADRGACVGLETIMTVETLEKSGLLLQRNGPSPGRQRRLESPSRDCAAALGGPRGLRGAREDNDRGDARKKRPFAAAQWAVARPPAALGVAEQRLRCSLGRTAGLAWG